MKRRRRRKCRHCQASSQRRWLSKAANKNYFCGPENVQRVQAWRQVHPGYWRGNRSEPKAVLQDDLLAQAVESNEKKDLLKRSALQDLLAHQGVVLIGLIAHLTGTALQDDIAETDRRLVGLGGDILNTQGGQYVDKTLIMPGTGPPDSRSVQLDRSAIGSR